jgi:hypothetical protein
VPGIGEVKIVSSSIFDIGVYFLVIGTVLAFLVALGADPIHESIGPGSSGSLGDDPHTRADDWAMDHDTSADHATEEDHR